MLNVETILLFAIKPLISVGLTNVTSLRNVALLNSILRPVAYHVIPQRGYMITT